MNNREFLNVLSESFQAFLSAGNSKSTAKLKPLHGAIASDIALRLPGYTIHSQGYGNDKEKSIVGRYMEKMVDILIEKDNIPYAGIAVKFIMQNYSQNSNNYFENMLGETANIRCHRYPYFQVLIIFDKLPYYEKGGKLVKWETFSHHNIEKYLTLSKDDPEVYFHTPNKMLIYVVHIPDNEKLTTHAEYVEYYKKLNPSVRVSADSGNNVFGSTVILNDYEVFADKIYHTVLAI